MYGSYISAAHLTAYSLWSESKDSLFWLNIYQLGVSGGAMLGPIMVEPFLLQTDTASYHRKNATQLQITNNYRDLDIYIHNNENSSEYMIGQSETNVMFAFMVGGVLVVILSLCCFVAHFAFGGIYVVIQKRHSSDSPTSTNAKGLKILILVLLVFYYIFQSVFLRTYSNYILAFTVNYLGWTKTQGANLTAAYFAAGMIYKIPVIYLVRVVKTEILVFVGLIMCNIAAVVLVNFVDVHDSIMWVFSIIISCGTNTIYGVLIAWTDKYIGIKGFIGVLYTVSGSIGEVIFSAVVGYLLANVSYMSFMYLLVSCTGGCLLIMSILQYLGMKYKSSTATMTVVEVKESDPLLSKAQN